VVDASAGNSSVFSSDSERLIVNIRDEEWYRKGFFLMEAGGSTRGARLDVRGLVGGGKS